MAPLWSALGLQPAGTGLSAGRRRPECDRCKTFPTGLWKELPTGFPLMGQLLLATAARVGYTGVAGGQPAVLRKTLVICQPIRRPPPSLAPPTAQLLSGGHYGLGTPRNTREAFARSATGRLR